MTPTQTPQQAAMQRLESLIVKSKELHSLAENLTDTALQEAVSFPKYDSPGPDGVIEIPIMLSDAGIVGLTRLKNGLGELVNYYTKQKEQLSASLAAISDRVNASLEAQKEEAPKKETAEALRSRIEKLAKPDETETQPSSEQGPHVHKTIRQDRNDVLAAAGQAFTEHIDQITEHFEQARAAQLKQTPTANANNLPTALPVVELSADDASSLRPQENSIQRLLGRNSPLLDIFAMSPWLQNGKGFVTIGTDGFNWYRGTSPFEKDPDARASLPTGFYSGQDVPEFVVLRMVKCIIIWNFKLDEPDHMSVYIVGPSDADPDNIRWFKPSELAASHTRQLITELLEVVEKYKPVVN